MNIPRENETECSCKKRLSGVAGSCRPMPYVNGSRATSAMLRGMLAVLLIILQT